MIEVEKPGKHNFRPGWQFQQNFTPGKSPGHVTPGALGQGGGSK